jgi:hypothetical protein
LFFLLSFKVSSYQYQYEISFQGFVPQQPMLILKTRFKSGNGSWITHNRRGWETHEPGILVSFIAFQMGQWRSGVAVNWGEDMPSAQSWGQCFSFTRCPDLVLMIQEVTLLWAVPRMSSHESVLVMAWVWPRNSTKKPYRLITIDSHHVPGNKPENPYIRLE